MAQSKRIKLTDLLPDSANANKGTERGAYMIDTSVAQFGAGRSILLDKDNQVIAGNKTLQALVDAGYTDILIVETDGKQAVAVKRTDLDLDDPKTGARGLAYADNRASEVGLAWDAEQLLADVSAGVDLDSWFLDWELDIITGSLGEDLDYEKAWQGMPEFEQEDIKPFHSIKVHFKSLEDLNDFSKLISQLVTEKTTYIFHPKQLKEDLTKFTVVDK